ncbi:HECD1-like protein, partial [Mya arenaria]
FPTTYILLAITYYLDVSAECTRRIVAVEGAVKALCNCLVLVDMESWTSKDLAEQCIKVHKDTLHSCMSVVTRLCGKVEPKDSSQQECVSSVSALLDHEDHFVSEDHFLSDGSLGCFASLADRFTRRGEDTAPLAAHSLINVLLQRLCQAGEPACCPHCRGSPSINHDLLRSDLPHAIECGLKDDERLFGKVLSLARPEMEEETGMGPEKEDSGSTEIVQGCPYHWRDWSLVQGRDCLYLWSDAAALELSSGSNGWFRFILDSKLATMYSSGSPEGWLVSCQMFRNGV